MMTSNTQTKRAQRRTYEREAKRGRGTKRMMSPKLMAAVLTAGMLILAGGAVFAATRPTWRPAKTATTSAVSARTGLASATAATIALAATSVHAATAATAQAATRAAADQSDGAASAGVRKPHASKPAGAKQLASVTYTVKPGDTLWGIARWFKFHGYGKLFEANRSVIGPNPSRIFPGQRITIRNGVMSLRGTAQNGRSGT